MRQSQRRQPCPMKLKQFAAQNPSGVTTYWHQSGGSPLWESPVSYPALLKMACAPQPFPASGWREMEKRARGRRELGIGGNWGIIPVFARSIYGERRGDERLSAV